MATRIPVCKKVWREDLSGVDFNFTNGHTIPVNYDDFTKYNGGVDGDDILRMAALHGLSQKIGDDFSGVKGDVDEAIELAEAVHERLLAGEWNISERVGPARSLVVEAVIRASKAQGVAFDEATTREKYLARTDAAKKLLESALSNSAVKAEIDKIKSERAAERAAASAEKAKVDGTAATSLASLV